MSTEALQKFEGDAKEKMTAIMHIVVTPLLKRYFDDVQFDIHAIRMELTPEQRRDGPLDATGVEILWPFTVTEAAVNRHKTLHGGVAAILVDTFSTMHALLLVEKHVT